jgi:hypothetical protein
MLNFSYKNIKGMYENWILWKNTNVRSRSYASRLMLGRKSMQIGVPGRLWRQPKGKLNARTWQGYV